MMKAAANKAYFRSSTRDRDAKEKEKKLKKEDKDGEKKKAELKKERERSKSGKAKNTARQESRRQAEKEQFCEAPEPEFADVDVNIVGVDLSFLKNEVNPRIGDRVLCSHCEASISHLNTVKDNKWKCLFCGTVNNCDLLEGEIPTEASLDYVIKPPQAKDTTKRNVIFCIDTSGSMGINVETRNKNDNKTRLDCIKNSFIETVNYLAQNSPETSVGIVCFGREVTVYGDCTGKEQVITNKVFDFDTVKDMAGQAPAMQPISKTHQAIFKRVKDIEENGTTALGAALLYSVVAASRLPGSQVVLASDGMSNYGIGNLEDSTDEDKEVFVKIAGIAKTKGVIIDIVTLQGCDANMRILGECARQTGGVIKIVRQDVLENVFDGNVQREIIATNVSLGIFVHPALFVADLSVSDSPSRHKQLIGNVVDGYKYNFRYELRPEKDRKQFGEIKEFPLQVQIEYERQGGVFVRVISMMQQVASDDELINENDVDGAVVQTYLIQQIGNQAKQNNTREARKQVANLKVASKQYKVDKKEEEKFQDMTYKLDTLLNEEDHDYSDDSEEMLYLAADCFM